MANVRGSVEKIDISISFSSAFVFLALTFLEIDVFKEPVSQTKYLSMENVYARTASSNLLEFAGPFLHVLPTSNGKFLLVSVNRDL